MIYRFAPGTLIGSALYAALAALPLAALGAGEPLPGAEPYPPLLQQRLDAALESLGPGYEPRTELRRPDGEPRFTNRLILEDSPYLLQHAHNPVDWHPWGDEALAKARREDKPVFLSIGYSTCHWCHVMERESFDNERIARVLNENFIAIKVDRERRPDVDEIYMTAVRLMIGRGGWPMSSFLTADGHPFFGGTYFPPRQFLALLERVVQVWGTNRDSLVAGARQITDAVRKVTAARLESESIDAGISATAVDEVMFRYAAEAAVAPKFPRATEMLLLLDAALRDADRESLKAVEKRLRAMAAGGIYDQIGGGFHRYATDARWLVPHFEKMLYNQALAARVYHAAWQITGGIFYRRIAQQTLDYVLREMTNEHGGFYSATDADSEGAEGTYFVWTPAEFEAALGAEDAALATTVFGVTEEGNFEHRNVLHLPVDLETLARRRGEPLPAFLARVDDIRERLRSARAERVPPIRDDKVLTAWNAMMITTLAGAADLSAEGRYLAAAERAAEFLWRSARDAQGNLQRVWLAGRPSVAATLEDYAYLAEALVSLHDVTGSGHWLDRAEDVAAGMVSRFWDAQAGGFFISDDTDANLIARPKSPTDGAMASANAVALRTLALLAARTGERSYADRASQALAAFSASIKRYPGSFAYMVLGASELAHGGTGPREYGAGGNVRAVAMLRRDGQSVTGVDIDVSIRDGWHVNSSAPLEKWLIPTALEIDGGWRITDIAYPEARTVELSFQDQPLAVYEGNFTISARLAPQEHTAPAAGEVLALRLEIQACSDTVCLIPEQLSLEVPVALPDGLSSEQATVRDPAS